MNEKKNSALGAIIKIFLVLVTICAAIAGISIGVYKALKKQINKKVDDDKELEIAVMASDDEEEDDEIKLD